MRAVSLFAGVGGIDLGLEAAGIHTVAQVERDDYCTAVLAARFPTAHHHDDVLTFPEWWAEQSLTAEVLTAGFPCQPFSLAGKQLGVDDERWLWPATARAVRAVRPRYVLLENVSALVRDARAFGWVLADLHRLGFDAEWATLRASDFGAPHGRERVYVLAHPTGLDGKSRDRLGTRRNGTAPIPARGLRGLDMAQRRQAASEWLAAEPRVDRLVDGIPAQSHRLRCAGNAVVPAVTRHIGQLIQEHEAWRAAA